MLPRFLTRQTDKKSKKRLSAFFSETPVWVATNQADQPLGFMFLHDGPSGGLFVDASARGLGVGKRLISHALELHSDIRSM